MLEEEAMEYVSKEEVSEAIKIKQMELEVQRKIEEKKLIREREKQEKEIQIREKEIQLQKEIEKTRKRNANTRKRFSNRKKLKRES